MAIHSQFSEQMIHDVTSLCILVQWSFPSGVLSPGIAGLCNQTRPIWPFFHIIRGPLFLFLEEDCVITWLREPSKHCSCSLDGSHSWVDRWNILCLWHSSDLLSYKHSFYSLCLGRFLYLDQDFCFLCITYSSCFLCSGCKKPNIASDLPLIK